ncbi:MAG: alpha/beta hydrolase, partial [Desulfobacteraceae bacterium]|nr:alpha/beta hydrolase [Desulfobacteraceae bacterium]
PTVFNNKIGANIYLLEKYDKTKIPILYIHGAGGSPRDFKPIVNNIDTNIYQAWFFHYPSGMKLEKTSEMLYKKLNHLYSRYRFQTLYITAHSMGGLVARSFIKKYNQDNRFNYLKGYISLATPYGGNEASRLGFEYSPVQVPCWEDVATNSQFLKDLYSTKMPEQIQFYLFFGYAGNNRIYKDPNDGAISLKSQLDPKIKKEATLTLGIDADHVSILSSKEMLKKYTEVLTTLKQKTDVLKNNFDYNFETDLTYRLQMELNPIMCITPDGFKDSQYKFDDIENAAPGGSVKLYKDMLESGNSLKIIKAARIICRSFIGNIILSETASRVLLEDFTKNIEDKLHSKAMAWLCNVLGLSKDIRYRLTLEKVLLESKDSKLKYYVEKNLSKLDEINIPSVDRFAMCTKGNCINGQGSMIFPDGIEYSGGFNR